MKTPALRTGIALGVRCALVGVALAGAGCATWPQDGGGVARARAGDHDDRLAAWSLGEPVRPAAGPAGGSWGLVFNSPTVNRAHAGVEARQFAEFSRNDAALGYRPQGPVMASNEWPERERASLAYPRRVYLDPRADQILFFENESRYRGYGGYRSVPVGPGDGWWGFWR